MSYARIPTSVVAGRALKQDPSHIVPEPVGGIPVVLDVDIATTTGLGVVQVGSGLIITPGGLLSATGGDKVEPLEEM